MYDTEAQTRLSTAIVLKSSWFTNVSFIFNNNTGAVVSIANETSGAAF